MNDTAGIPTDSTKDSPAQSVAAGPVRHSSGTLKQKARMKPKIKLSALHLNDGAHGLPKNPRFIKDDKFKKLVESIRDFPEAMPARGIVVDERGVILGGNMRYRGCKELGMKDIPASWVHKLTGLTVAQKRRFIIMDNRPFGEDDMDLLANEWDIEELVVAGFDEEELEGAGGGEDPPSTKDVCVCPTCGNKHAKGE